MSSRELKIVNIKFGREPLQSIVRHSGNIGVTHVLNYLDHLAEGPEGHLEPLGLKDRLQSVSLVDSEQPLMNA
jgi:hypothetical protein